MFDITIKNLEIRLNSSNLQMEKSAIFFNFLPQKRETAKQITGTLYYKY